MINIYIDESCQNAHRYMVLGGIRVAREHIVDIHNQLAVLRERHRMFGELRWTKVSTTKYAAYQDFVDAFFDLSGLDHIHFHSVIVDSSGLDNHKYNSGSREIGFSKFIYQLLIKFGRLYGTNRSLHCYLDSRTTQQSLEELRNILNNGIAKSWGNCNRPYRLVQFRDSKKCDLLQVNDIVLGAVASRKNGHHLRADCNQAKRALGEHIMRRANIRTLDIDTPMRVRRFTVWNFQLRQ